MATYDLTKEEQGIAYKLYSLCKSTNLENQLKLQKTAEVLHEMGRLYLKKAASAKRNSHTDFIIASIFLHRARVCCQEILGKSTKELIFKALNEMQDILNDKCHAASSPSLIKVSEEATATLRAARVAVQPHRDALTAIEEGLPEKTFENEKEKKILEVQKLLSKSSQLYKKILVQIAKSCVEILGRPPSKFVLIGLGSLARDEISLFSNFDYAIVLEEKVRERENYEEIFEYFQWFSTVFNIIVIGMGETKIPRSKLHSLKLIPKNVKFNFFNPSGISVNALSIGHITIPPRRWGSAIDATEVITPKWDYNVHLSGIYWGEQADIMLNEECLTILSENCFIFGSEQLYSKFPTKCRTILKSHDLASVKRQKLVRMFRVEAKDNVYELLTALLKYAAEVEGVGGISGFEKVTELKQFARFADPQSLGWALAVACELRVKSDEVTCQSCIDRRGTRFDCAGISSLANCFSVVYLLPQLISLRDSKFISSRLFSDWFHSLKFSQNFKNAGEILEHAVNSPKNILNSSVGRECLAKHYYSLAVTVSDESCKHTLLEKAEKVLSETKNDPKDPKNTFFLAKIRHLQGRHQESMQLADSAFANSLTLDLLEKEEQDLAEMLRTFCNPFGEERRSKLYNSTMILYQMGRVYLKKTALTADTEKKVDFIAAATLLHGARVRCQELLNDKKLEKSIIDTLTTMQNQLLKASNGVNSFQLLDISTQIGFNFETARAKLKGGLDSLTVLRESLPRDEFERERRRKIAKVSELLEFATNAYIKEIREIAKWCLRISGSPPCDFAILGLGSLARSEVTLYSDFEHMIILEEGVQDREDYENILEYFRWFSVVFHIIMIGIGETIIPSIGIKSLNDFSKDKSKNWFYDSFTPSGISFDVMMPHASKIPVGRQTYCREEVIMGTKKPFCGLIKPASIMAKYLTDDEARSNGYNLKEVLTQSCFVFGFEKLFTDFRNESLRVLAQNDKSPSILGTARLKQCASEKKFVEGSGSPKDVDPKFQFYRPLCLLIGYAAQIQGVDGKSSFEKISKLKKIPDLEDESSLEWAFAAVCELRMKIYESNYGNRAKGSYELLQYVGLPCLMNCLSVIRRLLNYIISNISQTELFVYGPNLTNIVLDDVFGKYCLFVFLQNYGGVRNILQQDGFTLPHSFKNSSAHKVLLAANFLKEVELSGESNKFSENLLEKAEKMLTEIDYLDPNPRVFLLLYEISLKCSRYQEALDLANMALEKFLDVGLKYEQTDFEESSMKPDELIKYYRTRINESRDLVWKWKYLRALATVHSNLGNTREVDVIADEICSLWGFSAQRKLEMEPFVKVLSGVQSLKASKIWLTEKSFKSDFYVQIRASQILGAEKSMDFDQYFRFCKDGFSNSEDLVSKLLFGQALAEAQCKKGKKDEARQILKTLVSRCSTDGAKTLAPKSWIAWMSKVTHFQHNQLWFSDSVETWEKVDDIMGTGRVFFDVIIRVDLMFTAVISYIKASAKSNSKSEKVTFCRKAIEICRRPENLETFRPFYTCALLTLSDIFKSEDLDIVEFHEILKQAPDCIRDEVSSEKSSEICNVLINEKMLRAKQEILRTFRRQNREKQFKSFVRRSSVLPQSQSKDEKCSFTGGLSNYKAFPNVIGKCKARRSVEKILSRKPAAQADFPSLVKGKYSAATVIELLEKEIEGMKTELSPEYFVDYCKTRSAESSDVAIKISCGLALSRAWSELGEKIEARQTLKCILKLVQTDAVPSTFPQPYIQIWLGKVVQIQFEEGWFDDCIETHEKCKSFGLITECSYPFNFIASCYIQRDSQRKLDDCATAITICKHPSDMYDCLDEYRHAIAEMIRLTARLGNNNAVKSVSQVLLEAPRSVFDEKFSKFLSRQLFDAAGTSFEPKDFLFLMGKMAPPDPLHVIISSSEREVIILWRSFFRKNTDQEAPKKLFECVEFRETASRCALLHSEFIKIGVDSENVNYDSVLYLVQNPQLWTKLKELKSLCGFKMKLEVGDSAFRPICCHEDLDLLVEMDRKKKEIYEKKLTMKPDDFLDYYRKHVPHAEEFDYYCRMLCTEQVTRKELLDCMIGVEYCLAFVEMVIDSQKMVALSRLEELFVTHLLFFPHKAFFHTEWIDRIFELQFRHKCFHDCYNTYAHRDKDLNNLKPYYDMSQVATTYLMTSEDQSMSTKTKIGRCEKAIGICKIPRNIDHCLEVYRNAIKKMVAVCLNEHYSDGVQNTYRVLFDAPDVIFDSAFKLFVSESILDPRNDFFSQDHLRDLLSKRIESL